MQTLPLKIDIPAMEKKIFKQTEEMRFNTLKHLLILRYQYCLAISDIVQLAKNQKMFSEGFIEYKITSCTTEAQLFPICKVLRDLRTMDLIPQTLQRLQLLSNLQLEKIYNKQFN